MSKSTTWEGGLLALFFTNADFTGLGDSGGIRGSVTPGSVYISLHTDDPGEGGTQLTNEISYTGYARFVAARNGSTWTISGASPTQAANTAEMAFGPCTSGTPVATHFAAGTSPTGAGKLGYSGQLDEPRSISPGITPKFAAGALKFTEQ